MNHDSTPTEGRDCQCKACRDTDASIRGELEAPTPPPTAAPEPPQVREALRVLYEETADYIRINNLGDVHHNRSMQMARDALVARPHRIGVWDYQSLCDCLRHNMERAIPGYVYRDPQDAIQTLAARVMTLQRKTKP